MAKTDENAFHSAKQQKVPRVWATMHELRSGDKVPVICILESGASGRVVKLFPSAGKSIRRSLKTFKSLLHDQQMLTDPEYVLKQKAKIKKKRPVRGGLAPSLPKTPRGSKKSQGKS